MTITQPGDSHRRGSAGRKRGDGASGDGAGKGAREGTGERGGAPPRFFGPRVVWSAFLLAVFGWGFGFYGPPVYLQAVNARSGFSLSFVSAMVTLHFLFGALVIANLPRFYARFGLPVVTSVGAVTLALGVVGWSIVTAPWQLVFCAMLTGAGWVTMGAAALNAIVSPWFVAGRSSALSTAYNGASIGGVILSPLWAICIETFSFPVAALVLGSVMIVAVVTLSLTVFSKTPKSLGQQPDGLAGPAAPAMLAPLVAGALPGRLLWRDRQFFTLSAGMALGLFAQIGLIAHLFSVLTPSFGKEVAGFAMALATACAIAGRMLIGRTMPPSADRRLVTSLSYAVQLIGSLVLLVSGGESVPLLIVGIVLFGAGIGNATSLPPLIAQKEFASEDVQRVVSLIVAVSQASYAFAPAAFGLLRVLAPRVTGGDGVSALFIAAAAIQALAIGVFLAGRGRAAPSPLAGIATDSGESDRAATWPARRTPSHTCDLDAKNRRPDWSETTRTH